MTHFVINIFAIMRLDRSYGEKIVYVPVILDKRDFLCLSRKTGQQKNPLQDALCKGFLIDCLALDDYYLLGVLVSVGSLVPSLLRAYHSAGSVFTRPKLTDVGLPAENASKEALKADAMALSGSVKPRYPV